MVVALHVPSKSDIIQMNISVAHSDPERGMGTNHLINKFASVFMSVEKQEFWSKKFCHINYRPCMDQKIGSLNLSYSQIIHAYSASSNVTRFYLTYLLCITPERYDGVQGVNCQNRCHINLLVQSAIPYLLRSWR